ncbi:hypothetical protein DB88DRAFT_122767 [Papiliotrema laurentii]|jgi:hypothetical protein|uniref:Uncharacterized protein n=1 Tax=Papiliotrema laurentii TaxID=5418 RepID=A0AAD9FLT2_PAPLA|nr:hypothetical protein DB88DRAFT_122767 [Papiliotrema laurentii]
MTNLTRFQRHMVYFAKPGTHQITLLSSIKASLALGLDFPVACALSIGMRVLYAPFPYLSPINISSITPGQSRSQLEHAPDNQQYYSRADLVRSYWQSPREVGMVHTILDLMHVVSFWAIAADVRTGLVDADTLRAFQQGEWQQGVVRRRKSRRRDVGEVLPLWRGGPIIVSGHSWFVKTLFGVRVYEP